MASSSVKAAAAASTAKGDGGGDSDAEFDGIRIEGEAAVREIAFAVDYAELSKALPATDDRVYINLKTKENDSFCVELCLQGFRIVGRKFDTRTEEADSYRYYETIYSLLDAVSPEYRFSFGEALKKRLIELQDSRQDEEL